MKRESDEGLRGKADRIEESVSSFLAEGNQVGKEVEAQ